MILFAHHNFIKDPPFSRLDLVSCRNVLIYLNNFAQERAIQTFHFALKPASYLLLGTSETTDGASHLFTQHNKEMRIFQARQVSGRAYPVPESIPSFHIRQSKFSSPKQETGNKMSDRITFGELHQRMLEKYAPPSLVINEAYEIVHTSERAVRFLQMSPGEPSQNLLKLIHPDLRLELRSALYTATQGNSDVEVRGLTVALEDKSIETINLFVRPVLRNDEITNGFMLVVFEPAESSQQQQPYVKSLDEPVARHLEEELVRTKGQLHSSVEQYELQAEDLKVSNEELQAMNEELRSAAEELETSKEELQSINEELSTVNQELKIKVEEATLTGNNLKNLINSVDIGTIFLDRNFRIMFFTPSARVLFNLIPSDFGRPLSDITTRLQYPDLLADSELVLEKLHMIEREVFTVENKSFLMRLLPYRTAEDHINGIVITFIDISRRVQSEENLRLSEERLRLLNDTIPQLIWASDANGHATYFNRQWFEYSGLSEEQSYGLGWEHLIHRDDAAYATSQWHQLVKDGKIFESEVRLKRKDGVYRWHIVRNIPVTNNNAMVVRWFGSGTDIHSLKTAETLARDSRELLRTMVESATDFAIITTDANGIIENWNQGAVNLLGYIAQEAIGKRLNLIFIPEDKESGIPDQEMNIAAQRGRALDERWHQRKDGSLVFMSGALTPMYQNNKLSGFVKIARDITAQKRAEEELTALEERYRIALASAEMGTWDWNIPDDKIESNPQLRTLIGLPLSAVNISGEEFLRFIHKADDNRIRTVLQQAIETVSVFHAEFRIVTNDNNEIHWVSAYGRALNAGSGTATRMVGVMHDITERKKLENEKEEFVNTASHEIKTPLTSIKAYAELLQEMFRENEKDEYVGYMKKMNAQIDRLNTLITDLLDTTKVAEGQLPLRFQEFDINSLIKELSNDAGYVSSTHRITVNTQGESFITADRERISQVLTNLISNAIKYSPQGGTVTVSSENDTNNISVSVADQGIGISADMQARVFDRFFRVANSASNPAPGMGLGLYISAGIIRRHGGNMSVSSEKGKGSIFTFSLPVNSIAVQENI